MKWTTAGAAALTLLVGACGYSQQERTTGGAAAGAATGAGIGALGGPVGALVGAGVGGVAGGVTGATTSPSDVNLGRPPWTNPETELPFDNRPQYASRGSAGGGAAAASSASVRRAQMDLRQAGYDPGPIDGIWGPRTARAVREFQQANNLPQTGRLDQQTVQALAGTSGGGAAMTGTSTPGTSGMGGGAAMGTGSLSQAQMDLQQAGYDPGPADGRWGPQTARAVREFQRDNNLPQTGQLDQRTMQALNAAAGGGSTTGTGAPGGSGMGGTGGGSQPGMGGTGSQNR